MKLDRQHRIALINQLRESENQLRTEEGLLRQFSGEEDKEHLRPLQMIHCFITEQKIKTIQEALIENEIDF